MSNEKFTDLPIAANANMTDIIAAVQGYVSPSVLGALNQATLQQVFNLFLNSSILSYAGNPNGFVAGQTYQLLWDTVHNQMYVNTVYGNTSTAVWNVVSSDGLSWNTIAAATANMISNNGYVVNYGTGLSTLTLPLLSAVGDEIIVMGYSASGYSIAQNAGQQIIISGVTTTLGVTGSISSTNRYDAITLRCMLANTIWGVPSGVQAIFTIV